MLDSGMVTFYAVRNAAERGAYPLRCLSEKCSDWFEERTVGMSRYYAAKQANVQVDMVIRVWRNDEISTQDIACINREFFKIMQVQQTTDKDEMLVTDITLERTVEKFDIGRTTGCSCGNPQ